MNLSCAAVSIKVVSSAKSLGAFIDDELDFQEHIKHLKKSLAFSGNSKLTNKLSTKACIVSIVLYVSAFAFAL